MIKPSVLQHFVREWLAARGQEPRTLEPDVWAIHVPKDLRERLGTSELVLSFHQKALARHPKSELATVGNPIFDRLLAVAREEGRIGLVFAPPVTPSRRPPSASKAGTLGGQEPDRPEPIYQAVYHFVFTVTYPTIEAPDEMEVISVDGGSMDVLAQTPDIHDLWVKLEAEPRKGRLPIPPLPVPEAVLQTALGSLEKRMRRRIRRVSDMSKASLEQETDSIKVYYEQLIEEAKHQGKRWTKQLSDRENRIHWLQLEWKRRIEEATAFWRTRVDARLVAIGVQMQPRTGYRLAVPKGSGTGRSSQAASRRPARVPMLVWDDENETFLAPYCENCGKKERSDLQVQPTGRILCPVCAQEAPRPLKPPLLRVEVGGKAIEPKPGRNGGEKRGTRRTARLTLVEPEG